MTELSLIVAMDRNGLIGNNNDLPWRRLKADLEWFREHTLGKSIIMGRKTHDSIGVALPRRENIVLSRNPDYAKDGIVVVPNIEEALNVAQHDPVIIGGRAVYEEGLPLAAKVIVTRVDGEFEGDVYFPDFDFATLTKESEERREADADNAYALTFTVYRCM